MIYLLETGLCLSLLYLAYWFFLRKETYFNFNRVFLIGSLALTLVVPLLHLSFFIPQGSSLENPVLRIAEFRNSYQEMIRMIDADFGTEPGIRHSMKHGGAGENGIGEVGTIPTEETHGVLQDPGDSESGIGGFRIGLNFSFSTSLLIIYICGVIYFLIRLVYLMIRLYLLAKRNRVTRQEGFRMVEIEEEISPFSFFHFLFINNGSFSESELHNVLEHEKAHIRQKHTMDHLFVHMLAVFQWFNPFAWQMRKALKTTHEYIADQQVIDRGFELLDYQSLLLRQVIGYHSVELVNNFNLKPIKKRIAMMNKTRSGVPARLKAILVTPFAILIFFLFADFTLKGSSAATDPIKELSGLWIKQSDDSFSEKIYIEDGKFSYVDGTEIRQYDAQLIKEGEIAFKSPGSQWATKYSLSGDKLIFSWNPWSEESHYIRSKASNSLDQLLLENNMELDLPQISQYRLLEKESLIYRIGIGLDNAGKTIFSFNGEIVPVTEISWRVNSVVGELSIPDMRKATGVFLVDRSVPMSEVEKARQELRGATMFLVAEGGYPHGDMALSPLLYHSVALPRLLPPKDAKVLEKEVVEEMGGSVHTIDLTDRNSTPRNVAAGLQQFIKSTSDNKYVISLEYDEEIPYGQYVETVDMIYNVVYSFRNELAMERYDLPYHKLGDELQRELRKVYPMAISETMKGKSRSELLKENQDKHTEFIDSQVHLHQFRLL
ncbi:MAG: M56 family metallopeptidase [Bacteroidota bacterium]